MSTGARAGAGGVCPVCKNPIKLVDATGPLSYGGQVLTLHYKCIVENQELFARLESRYPGVPLDEAIKRWRAGG